MERRLRAPAAEQAAAAALTATLAREATSRSGLNAQPPLADVATTVAGVRGAGALFPGQDLERASASRWVLSCGGQPVGQAGSAGAAPEQAACGDCILPCSIHPCMHTRLCVSAASPR